MRNIGIIAEYNPFHNGHKYQLDYIKEKFNPETITVVMSQDTVQRGEFASFDKFFRTETALNNGADLILGLPFYASNASAEFFAQGSLRILNDFGVDTLVFGSESGDLKNLEETARFLVDHELSFINLAKKNPTISYPRLLETFLRESNINYRLAQHPNNILSLEYLKGIYKNNYDITPITIERIGSGYNDLNLTQFSSASGIRQAIINKNLADLKLTIPYSDSLLTNNFQNLNEDRIYASIVTEISNKSVEELENIVGINNSFAHKLKKAVISSTDYPTFIERLKSKDNIRTGINRSLLNLLAGLTKEDFKQFYNSSYIPYFRLLGFKTDHKNLLKGKSPIIANVSRDLKRLDKIQKKAFEYDLKVANLASLNLNLEEYNKDYLRKPVIIK